MYGFLWDKSPISLLSGASRGQMCVFGRSLGVVVWVFRRASELRTSHLDIE